ncbi:hypothetical protein Tco_1151710, partial [Tanacetum coccineum]
VVILFWTMELQSAPAQVEHFSTVLAFKDSVSVKPRNPTEEPVPLLLMI